jgi:hypothetical protein
VITDAAPAVLLAGPVAAAAALAAADGAAELAPGVALAVPAAEVLDAAELQAATAKDMVAATAAARAIAEPVLRDLARQRIRWASSRYVPIFLSPFPGRLNGAFNSCAPLQSWICAVYV